MLAPERKKQEKPNPDVLLLKFWEDSKTRKPISHYQGLEVKVCINPNCPDCKGVFFVKMLPSGKKIPPKLRQRDYTKVRLQKITPRDKEKKSFYIAHIPPSEIKKNKPLRHGGLFKRRIKTQVDLVHLGGMPGRGGSALAFWNREKDRILGIDWGLRIESHDPKVLEGLDEHINPFQLPCEDFLIRHIHRYEGIIGSHRHEDHIGAMRYFPREVIDSKLPIYLTPWPAECIKYECDIAGKPIPNIYTFKPGQEIVTESFKVRSFELPHSTPESCGFIVETGNVKILVLTDFKLTCETIKSREETINKLKQIAKQERIDTLVLDAIGASRPGISRPHEEIVNSIGKIIDQSPGRVIISLFSTNLDRIKSFIREAEERDRYALPYGRGMETSFGIANKLGYIEIKNTPQQLEFDELIDPARECLFVTGCQGEPGSQLYRMAMWDQDSNIRQPQSYLQKDDTVIISSDPIPGNENSFFNVVRGCLNHHANVWINEDIKGRLPGDLALFDRLKFARTHVSGHEAKDGLRLILSAFPKIPVYLSHATYEAIAVFQNELIERNRRLILPVRVGECIQI